MKYAGAAPVSSSTASIAAPRASPDGRLPSVSTVNEITTGIPCSAAARVTPIASALWVMVTAVTRSASVREKVPIWVAWYRCASVGLISSDGR